MPGPLAGQAVKSTKDFLKKVPIRYKNFKKQWKDKKIGNYATFNPFKDY